jgi:hypothetical protein
MMKMDTESVLPNPAHALDGGIPFRFQVGRHCAAASGVRCSAT